MRLLLDTHVLLWALSDRRMSRAATTAIRDPLNDVLASAATLWELAIKASLGRLTIPEGITEVLAEQDVEVLAITGRHALAVRDLPPLHRDPFDRLLVAQSRLEHLTLVTRDEQLAVYGIDILPA